MNVLVFGTRVIGVELANELVENFPAAIFKREECYSPRLKKVHALENESILQ